MEGPEPVGGLVGERCGCLEGGRSGNSTVSWMESHGMNAAIMAWMLRAAQRARPPMTEQCNQRMAGLTVARLSP